MAAAKHPARFHYPFQQAMKHSSGTSRSVLRTEMDDLVITLVRCGDLTCRLGRSSGDHPDDQLLHSGQRAVPAQPLPDRRCSLAKFTPQARVV